MSQEMGMTQPAAVPTPAKNKHLCWKQAAMPTPDKKKYLDDRSELVWFQWLNQRPRISVACRCCSCCCHCCLCFFAGAVVVFLRYICCCCIFCRRLSHLCGSSCVAWDRWARCRRPWSWRRPRRSSRESRGCTPQPLSASGRRIAQHGRCLRPAYIYIVSDHSAKKDRHKAEGSTSTVDVPGLDIYSLWAKKDRHQTVWSPSSIDVSGLQSYTFWAIIRQRKIDIISQNRRITVHIIIGSAMTRWLRF